MSKLNSSKLNSSKLNSSKLNSSKLNSSKNHSGLQLAVSQLISPSDFAKMKHCTRKTVFNNMKHFNFVKIGHFTFIVLDDKSNQWTPDYSRQRQK